MTHIEAIEGIYSAFRSGDIPYILTQLTPDVFWRQPAGIPWGGDYSGPAQVGEFFAKIDAAAETTAFDVEENVEAGNVVFSLGYWEGRMPSSGKVARSRFAFRWQFQDNKIYRYEGVLDTAPIVAALAG